MSTAFTRFKEGVLDENPLYSQALALCPAIAVATLVVNGIGLGLTTLAVLLLSCLTVSLLRKIIPNQLGLLCFLIISATYTTIAYMIFGLYFPSLHTALGMYIPLIAVNCAVLAKMETIAAKNSPAVAAFDALVTGLGYTLILVLISAVRELLGSGSIMGTTIIPGAFPRILVMNIPAGGFLLLGFLVIAFRAVEQRRRA